jgi:hypothetical protein
MPKKTKKQKILAKLHRKLSIEPPSFNNVKSQNIERATAVPAITSPTFSFNKNSVATAQNMKNVSDYSYLKYDLIRITIFTASAIILQGVLYFFLHRG